MRLKKEEKEKIEILGLNPSYVYDHGFGLQVYHCLNWNCDGHNLKIIHKGGFQLPNYECQDCEHISSSPKNTKISKMYNEVDEKFNELLISL